MRQRKHRKSLFRRLSIRTKLLVTFALTAVLMFVVNILLYSEINHSMKKLNQVYATNISLNEFTECLDETHENVLEYLNTKSSNSLEDYYRNVQEYRDMMEQLNDSIVDSKSRILEKNIRNIWILPKRQYRQSAGAMSSGIKQPLRRNPGTISILNMRYIT